MNKINVGILISGRGSNMSALLQAAESVDYPARITCVISNRSDAGGLAVARAKNIPYEILLPRDYSSREAYDAALVSTLQHYKVEVVACAGFMRILTPVMVDAWSERLINIHPSLLPHYKGLDTHARALADGATVHGCTVHYVTAELDGGPIIAQKEVPVQPDDNEESLAARVLVAEHQLYTQALATVCHRLNFK